MSDRPSPAVTRFTLVAAVVLLGAVANGTSTPRTHLPAVRDEEAGSLERALERMRELSIPLRPPESFGVPADGGRAIAHYADGLPAPALQARAPRGSVSSVGALALEPSLGVDRRGRIFYAATGPFTQDAVGVSVGLGLQNSVLRSGDGGRTWRDVSPTLGPARRHTITLDPMLHVDERTSRVFASDLQYDMCGLISFSDDAGRSWTTSKACGLTDHQNIFTGPPVTSTTVGYPDVVYYCAVDGGAASQWSTANSCLKSLDGGITWLRTGAPAYTDRPGSDGGQIVQGHCAGGTGHGFVDHKGTAYLPRGWCGQPYLAISRDEGASWERVQVARNGMPTQFGLFPDGQRRPIQVEHESGAVVDRDGNIYYFWMAENRLPYLTISQDGGRHWTKPRMIGFPGLKEAWGPTIAVGGVGKIAVAYVGSMNAFGGDGPQGYGEEYEGTEWNGYIAMTANALASKPLFYSGTVHNRRDPLIRGECAIIRCGAEFDFIDVAITPSGIPVAAFVDGCRPRARGRCGDGSDPETQIGVGLLGRLEGGPTLR